ncbi:hypothetical protein GCM10011374_37600 [Kocuria dechangensis]|uniref:Uncharacterized protein n=1 Tax=Kocuria dechangensis TaxID=1176249 RepID=A0A917H728_9MICC|nr:hypothetical protein [Kocuria dechangensis]GGG69618.1 hypothetical protein GCM10011374_37600 [Kocuria dechangensis]
MGFEVFDKRMTPLAKAPSVTIQKRGVISLNKAAHDLIDNAETVELLYDRARNVVALRQADDSAPHAYAVRSGSKNGPGQAIVSATAFTQHYGIDTTATRRWKPFTEDGMLCVDLTQEGTIITGNRTKTLAPVPPTGTSETAEADEADQAAETTDPPATVESTTNNA